MMCRIFIVPTLGLLLSAIPAGGQEAPEMTLFLHYSFESYASDASEFSDWHTTSVGLQRTAGGTSILGEALHAQRFGAEDVAVAVELYQTLWSGAYAGLRVEVAPESEVLASRIAGGELYQSIGAGFVLGASYRLMDAGPEMIHLRGASLTKYLGPWYLRGGGFHVSVGGVNSAAITGTARRYFRDDSFLQISGSRGSEVVLIGVGPRLELRRTRSISVHGETFISRRWGMRLTAAANVFENLPLRRGLAGGLLFRW